MTHRMLATLLGNLPGMAYRARNEPTLALQFVSDGARDLTGYAPGEIISDPGGWARLIHAEDRDAVLTGQQAAFHAKKAFRLTYRLIAADASQKWVLDQGRGITDPNGNVLALEGFVTDITERVTAQRLLEQRIDALTRIAASQTFDQPLEKLLDGLAMAAVDVTKGVACVVVLIDDEQRLYRVVGIHGMPEGYAEAVEDAYQAGAKLSSVEAFRTCRPVQRTIREYMVDDPRQAPVYQMLRDAAWNTMVSVPLLYRGVALGALSCAYPIGFDPDRDEITFLQVIADQAAVAVQTARLFADVQGKAALEERQRLARELHDSVSQALFGIGLGARTARLLLDRDPAKVAEPLDYVINLAEVGLTEMRALIFELRPDALETEGLVRLLEQQAAALRARHGLTVETDFGPEPVAPLAVKEMLYRITQETLHNSTKHARAQSLKISLRHQAEGIVLDVVDDGVGFDPSGTFPGHLGLRSMHERASSQGALLEIASAPGMGTRVRLVVPSAQ